MSTPVPPRVQAILDEIEREAAALRGGPAVPAPPRVPERAMPVPVPATAVPEGVLSRASAVVEEVAQVRASLDALSEAVEDIAGRLAARLDPSRSEPGPTALPALAQAAAPVAAVPPVAPATSSARATPASPAAPGTPAAAPPSVPAVPAVPAPDAARAQHALARLVAADMAASGATREAVAARLRANFGWTDAEATLEDVFGPRT